MFSIQETIYTKKVSVFVTNYQKSPFSVFMTTFMIGYLSTDELESVRKIVRKEH